MDELQQIPTDRDTLYAEVWANPVTIVAARYGLSDVGLAKICRALNIPLPSRGYWAKLKAGRVMKQVPLPKLKGPVPSTTRLIRLTDQEAQERQASKQAASKVKKQVEKQVEQIAVLPDANAPLHPLVATTMRRLSAKGNWPTNPALRLSPKEVLHVSVTQESLDRAIRLLDAVLKALSSYSITVAIDVAQGKTFLEFPETGTRLELELTEQVRRSNHVLTRAEELAKKRYYSSDWRNRGEYPQIPQYDYTPTGVLKLSLGRWPSKSWSDTPRTQLGERLATIVSGTIAFEQEVHAQEMESARRRAAHQMAVEQYKAAVERRKLEVENFKDLELQAESLERAERLRTLANTAEHQALSSEGVCEELCDWLAWVRAKADWLDPFVHVSDAILDAPEPKPPGYW